MLRTLGQWMGKLRRMASEFQNQFQEAMREAELADLKKEVDEMARPGAELCELRSGRATSARSSESTQQQIESAIAAAGARSAAPSPPSRRQAPPARGGRRRAGGAPGAGRARRVAVAGGRRAGQRAGCRCRHRKHDGKPA